MRKPALCLHGERETACLHRNAFGSLPKTTMRLGHLAHLLRTGICKSIVIVFGCMHARRAKIPDSFGGAPANDRVIVGVGSRGLTDEILGSCTRCGSDCMRFSWLTTKLGFGFKI